MCWGWGKGRLGTGLLFSGSGEVISAGTFPVFTLRNVFLFKHI
jgi:hypothetical protein